MSIDKLVEEDCKFVNKLLRSISSEKRNTFALGRGRIDKFLTKYSS